MYGQSTAGKVRQALYPPPCSYSSEMNAAIEKCIHAYVHVQRSPKLSMSFSALCRMMCRRHTQPIIILLHLVLYLFVHLRNQIYVPLLHCYCISGLCGADQPTVQAGIDPQSTAEVPQWQSGRVKKIVWSTGVSGRWGTLQVQKYGLYVMLSDSEPKNALPY